MVNSARESVPPPSTSMTANVASALRWMVAISSSGSAAVACSVISVCVGYDDVEDGGTMPYDVVRADLVAVAACEENVNALTDVAAVARDRRTTFFMIIYEYMNYGVPTMRKLQYVTITLHTLKSSLKDF